MNDEFDELPVDMESDLSARDWAEVTDVPHHLDQLPNGTETLVFGDPEGCKEFNHTQGVNDFHFMSDCGLVACEDVLRQFGHPVNENDLVHHAVDHGECGVVKDHPDQSGRTSV
jgi:hypothetical protein